MKIIAVFKTHFDFGYTGLAKEVLEKYRTNIIGKVMDVCFQTRKYGDSLCYKWTLPAWLLNNISSGLTKSEAIRFDELVQSNQIACHALPFTVHTELLDKNQLDDLFIPAREFTQKYNKPFPISAKMTDVPGHTCAIIKPLLSNGVKFLHLGKNPYSTAPDVPLLFWWEDKAGNRILTMYNQFYGSRIKPPKGWKFPVWLALNQTGDNEGAHNSDIVMQIKKQLPQNFQLVTGSLDDFAKELLSCDLSSVPVIRGELGDTWIHGAGTYPCVMGRFRRSRELFYNLCLNAELQKKDISTEIYNFKDNALQFTEHTFGINVCRFIGYEREYEKEKFLKERAERKEYSFAEKSWEEQRCRVYELEKINSALTAKLDYKVLNQPISLNNGYNFCEENGKIIITTPSGTKIIPNYEYRIIGSDKLNLFMKKYLVRFSDWSTVDFGKLRYPEIDDIIYRHKIDSIKKENGELKVFYKTAKTSFEDYGNCTDYSITFKLVNGGVNVKLHLNNKQATPFVEAGNMIFKTSLKGDCYIVQKCGSEIDVKHDIVENANQIMWACDKYSQIDNLRLYSVDAPLVSFCNNAVMEWNGGKTGKYKPQFCVNLFNNQWGTNFPQWIEGNFDFEFMITEGV